MEALRDAVPTSGAVGPRVGVAGWVADRRSGLAGLVALRRGRQPALVDRCSRTLIDVRRPGRWPGRSLARAMARLADHGRRGGGWRMAARNIARNSRRVRPPPPWPSPSG